MSELKTYSGESSVDLSIRGFSHLEGLLKFCIDNGVAIDHEESVGVTDRLVDDAVKAELRNNRPMFPPRAEPKKERVTVNNGQNLVDLALQETGSVEGFVAFLRANEFSPADDPEAGVELKTLTADVKNAEVRNYYKALAYVVNTGDAAGASAPEGIFDFTFDFTFE